MFGRCKNISHRVKKRDACTLCYVRILREISTYDLYGFNLVGMYLFKVLVALSSTSFTGGKMLQRYYCEKVEGEERKGKKGRERKEREGKEGREDGGGGGMVSGKGGEERKGGKGW